MHSKNAHQSSADSGFGNLRKGSLFVVATPIGNLGDMPPRAVSVLKESDLILAEDTRKFKRLAERFDIGTRCLSYHEHNEMRRAEEILKMLEQGAEVALVSEAGTPTISDPGYRIVSACKERGITVAAVPGPCSAIAALSISGFEINRFCFEGFLPHQGGKRESAIKRALENDAASVFFESPYRVISSLEIIARLDPEREIFLARELTKKFEETFRGSAAELRGVLVNRGKLKGEFVLIIRGSRKKRP